MDVHPPSVSPFSGYDVLGALLDTLLSPYGVLPASKEDIRSKNERNDREKVLLTIKKKVKKKLTLI